MSEKIQYWDGDNGPYEVDVPDEQVERFKLDHGIVEDDTTIPFDTGDNDTEIQKVDGREVVISDVRENQTGADNPTDTTLDGTGKAAKATPKTVAENNQFKGQTVSK